MFFTPVCRSFLHKCGYPFLFVTGQYLRLATPHRKLVSDPERIWQIVYGAVKFTELGWFRKVGTTTYEEREGSRIKAKQSNA